MTSMPVRSCLWALAAAWIVATALYSFPAFQEEVAEKRYLARIARLLVDGRPAAFRYYFLLEGRMVGNGTGYDAQFASCSPGWLLMLAALEAAASEGADTVEFLGGDEPYKLQFADRLDPLYEAIGLPGSARGKVAATCMVRTIQLRRRLRESERLRHFYYDGLAPVRRARQRLRRVVGS